MVVIEHLNARATLALHRNAPMPAGLWHLPICGGVSSRHGAGNMGARCPSTSARGRSGAPHARTLAPTVALVPGLLQAPRHARDDDDAVAVAGWLVRSIGRAELFFLLSVSLRSENN